MEAYFRPFELEIVETYKRIGKGVGWKGRWIRGWLLTTGSSYVYEMYKAWLLFCKRAELFADVRIKPGTYQSFRTYFYLLNRLGLVEKITEIPAKRGVKRSYYRIAPGMENHPAWNHPFQALYPSTDWKLLPIEERRRLREKYRPARRGEEEFL